MKAQGHFILHFYPVGTRQAAAIIEVGAGVAEMELRLLLEMPQVLFGVVAEVAEQNVVAKALEA
jgi:hypothetical protein